MLQEHEIIPYHISDPIGERVIVLAPHPDDETLGCGGTIRLLIEAGKEVKVVFLTSGEKADTEHPKSRLPLTSPVKGGEFIRVRSTLAREGVRVPAKQEYHMTEYALLREREAEKALKILGVSDYGFMRFPDRGIHERYEDVLHTILKTVEEFKPDTIYAPSMVEVNPDHRTAAAVAIEMQRIGTQRLPGSGNLRPVRIVFCEITIPLRPNVLVDITSVYSRKKKAAKSYKSQMKLTDYLAHITAMNTIRALTVSGPRYVEAFWFIDRPISEEDITGWLSYKKTLKT
jgi:LmbE family N-acetylglucosaminyl deacetylase